MDNRTTRHVDDIVALANETLSKFAQKTNELKTTINALQPPLSFEQPKLEQNTVIDQQNNQRLWWALPSMFVIGVMIGAGLAFLALK